jgi:hypothetical protein
MEGIYFNELINNNNLGSTALYGLGPPLFCCCSIDPDVTARAIWQAVRRLG